MGCGSSVQTNSAHAHVQPRSPSKRGMSILVSSADDHIVVDDDDNSSYLDDDVTSEQASVRNPTYSYTVQEDSCSPSKYAIQAQIGKGHFADVFLCVEVATGQQFAMKVIDKRKISRKFSFSKEVEILRKVGRHPNVVALIDYWQTDSACVIIMELCRGGDLFSRLVEGALSEARGAAVLRQLADAIQWIHKCGIVHRDLKPDNILLMSPDSDQIKVADFGLSKITIDDNVMRTVCGTWAYCAPEVIRRRPYTEKVDIWTLGVIMFTILGGYNPFDVYGDLNELQLITNIEKLRFDFDDAVWDDVSDEAKYLIRGLLIKDPHKRLSLSHFLASPWVQGKTVKEVPAPTAQQNLRRFNSSRTDFRTSARAALAAIHWKTKAGVQTVPAPHPGAPAMSPLAEVSEGGSPHLALSPVSLPTPDNNPSPSANAGVISITAPQLLLQNSHSSAGSTATVASTATTTSEPVAAPRSPQLMVDTRMSSNDSAPPPLYKPVTSPTTPPRGKLVLPWTATHTPTNAAPGFWRSRRLGLSSSASNSPHDQGQPVHFANTPPHGNPAANNSDASSTGSAPFPLHLPAAALQLKLVGGSGLTIGNTSARLPPISSQAPLSVAVTESTTPRLASQTIVSSGSLAAASPLSAGASPLTQAQARSALLASPACSSGGASPNFADINTSGSFSASVSRSESEGPSLSLGAPSVASTPANAVVLRID